MTSRLHNDLKTPRHQGQCPDIHSPTALEDWLGGFTHHHNANPAYLRSTISLKSSGQGCPEATISSSSPLE